MVCSVCFAESNCLVISQSVSASQPYWSISKKFINTIISFLHLCKNFNSRSCKKYLWTLHSRVQSISLFSHGYSPWLLKQISNGHPSKVGHLLFLYSCPQCYSLRNAGSGDENDFSSHWQSLKIPASKYISYPLCFFFFTFFSGIYSLSPLSYSKHILWCLLPWFLHSRLYLPWSHNP